MKNIINCVLLLFVVLSVGCIRPPNVPELEVVENFETAFVFKLEGGGETVRFESAESLENNKVASKRIEITQRWRPMGYSWQWTKGEYIPNIRVLKVNRTPVTTEWMPETESTGPDTPKKIISGIWAESADSIGLSTGFRLTGYVTEEDSAKFLYMYRGGALQEVLQGEVKTRVQELFTDFCARYPLDTLRNQKGEMFQYIKENTLPMFKERGVTISALAATGGFSYENADIQEAIDEVFEAQQEKEVAKAQLEAQHDKNKRIELEASALAEAARKKASGEADGIELIKVAEAKGIELVNNAAEAAKENPLVYKFRFLQTVEKISEKWDGSVPRWVMGGESADMSLLIDPNNLK